MGDRVLLKGLAVSGYRSFGPELSFLHPCGKINLLAGINNAGKSSLLRVLHHHLPLHDGYSDPIPRLDAHYQNVHGVLRVGLPIRAIGIPDDENSEGLKTIRDVLREWLIERGAVEFNNELWAIDDRKQGGWIKSLNDSRQNWASRFSSQAHWVRRLLQPTVHVGDDARSLFDFLIAHFNPFSPTILPVITVPEFRRIGSGDSAAQYDCSGTSLITQLGQLQNPHHSLDDQAALRQRFEDIQEFTRRVLGDATVDLEVSRTPLDIQIWKGGRCYPLSSLGTGVHQVILLAAAATIHQKRILCIEEPEIHLHPTTQRALLQYLDHHTTNQYFITTHSASLIDYPSAKVFHVWAENGVSRVRSVSTSADRWRACDEMGYHASSLVQSNCVLWVEGPSDRIYLRHWISLCDQTLQEGLHYTIAFTGGDVANHLTADDPETTELVSIITLNRRAALMLDSDRRAAGEELESMKTTLRDGVVAQNGIAWILDRRTVENYIPEAVLRETVEGWSKRSTGAGEKLVMPSHFSYVLDSVGRALGIEKPSKVKLAQSAVRNWRSLESELKVHVEKFVQFIRESNPPQWIEPPRG